MAFLGPYRQKLFERVIMKRAVEVVQVAFDFSSPAVINAGDPVTPRTLLLFYIVVDEGFNDATAVLTVGDSGTPDRYVAALDTDLMQIGVYELPVFDHASGVVQPRLYCDFAASTQGRGRVFLLLEGEPA